MGESESIGKGPQSDPYGLGRVWTREDLAFLTRNDMNPRDLSVTESKRCRTKESESGPTDSTQSNLLSVEVSGWWTGKSHRTGPLVYIPL